ncbi:MAG: hypothetical protein H0X34_10325 [Chthoniobacterales bacterium]|nr:hypothetical protein [Chthoniobacterales bacterium]
MGKLVPFPAVAPFWKKKPDPKPPSNSDTNVWIWRELLLIPAPLMMKAVPGSVVIVNEPACELKSKPLTSVTAETVI